MQRSRKARRALENSLSGISGKKWRLFEVSLLYEVCLSVMVFLLLLVFLLNPVISHGDSGVQTVNETLQETETTRLKLPDINFLQESHLDASSESRPSNNKAPDIGETESSLSSNHKDQIDEVNEFKNEKLSREAPLGLNEFKSKASNPKGDTETGQVGVIHRIETNGEEYNYASATKGAKVLASNKASKGASNILGKDRDKYLRNPCSAEEKFVVIELSEETLVDTIGIANFEHHSSNLKDFEVLGSMVYPTDRWVSLGKFTAENLKLVQRFVLQDPNWVRYLKLKLLSHYGTDFYCTLSVFKVYGVDAVEKMLDDLVSVDQTQAVQAEETTTEQTAEATTPPELRVFTKSYQDLVQTSYDMVPEKPTRPKQVGRMSGENALKILVQKVRSMDLNLSILERYLEELNSRYRYMFKEIDNEIAAVDTVLEKIKSDMNSLVDRNEVIDKDVNDLMVWKSLVSLQMDSLATENAILRSQVEKVLDNQVHLENKSLAVFILSFLFGCLAATKLFIDRMASQFTKPKSRKVCGMRSSWFVVLVSSTLVIVILLL